MNSFYHFVLAYRGSLGSTTAEDSRRAIFVRRGEAIGDRRESTAARLLGFRSALLPLALAAGGLCMVSAARAQSAPDATAEGYHLYAGGVASAYDLDYSQAKKMGASVFVDVDNLHHYGVEGEARWLSFPLQPNEPIPSVDVHATTYLIGPRYSRVYGRFQPYLKGLVGIGQINLSYNFGADSCFVAAPGAGVDFRLTRRISWRAADVEYQFWPQFEYGTLKSYGVSSGIRIKIF